MNEKEKNYDVFTSECFSKVDTEGLDKFINDTTGMDEESVEIYEVAKKTLEKLQDKYVELQDAKKSGLTTSEWLEEEIQIATDKICSTPEEAEKVKSVITEGLEKTNIGQVKDAMLSDESSVEETETQIKTEEKAIKNGGSY